MPVTTSEIERRAFAIAREAMVEAQRKLPWLDDPDSVLIANALHMIEQEMLVWECGGDKKLARKLFKEKGPQLKPNGPRARAIERAVKKRGEP